MAVITPRGGASLAQVVQTALNIAGSSGVSIVTGGTGNGVQLPDAHVAAVEEALGWTAAERPEPPTPAPTPPPSVAVVDEPVTEADPEPPAPALTPEPPTEPEVKATPKKSTPRRARRGEKG